MNGKLKEAFEQIQAEEALKAGTKAFLSEKTTGYAGAVADVGAGGSGCAWHGAARRSAVCAAACACLMFMLSGGHWLYFAPVMEISIDINPSIEISLNRFGRVVGVDGLNDDGRELAKLLDIKFMRYTDAIEEILSSEKITVLLSADEVMAITVFGQDEAQTSEMLSEIQAYTARQTNVHCYSGQWEDVEEAHGTGLSHGKYGAYLKIRTLDPGITPEEVQGMTMREIGDLISELSGGEEEAIFEEGCESGHHGSGGRHGGGGSK